MNRYEELYKSEPSALEVEKIKAELEKENASSSWEDYYWGAKCISKYDTANINPKLLAFMVNEALRYGLTYRTNKNCYLDAIKILANMYGLLGQHQLLLNCLNSVLELDTEAPDWVYHDLVAAQNRTKMIKRNLRKPKMFLSDLAHNDGDKAATKKKQVNIFKEFLAAGIVYLSENPDAEVDVDSLKETVGLYGLETSKEWKTFLDACNGKVSQQIKDNVEIIEEEKEDNEPTAGVSSGRRPLIISLFPEDDAEDDKITDMEKKYQELVERLSATQKELDSKKKELEQAGSTLDKLTEANSSLEASVKKHQSDMTDYERELASKTQEIADLEKRLISAKNGSSEKEELEKQLQSSRAQQKEMSAQIDAVKVALQESESRLKSAGEQIQRSAAENKALRDELEKAKSEKKEFSTNKAATIRGRCKTLEYITTEKLAKWLKKQLSYFNGYWEKCVIDKLSPDQASKAMEGHYSTLEEFDLAALLRIFDKNWSRLSQNNFLSTSDRECVGQMFSVRNNLAHSNVAPISKDELLEDLAIMSSFLEIINASAESKEVAQYAVEISKMELA